LFHGIVSRALVNNWLLVARIRERWHGYHERQEQVGKRKGRGRVPEAGEGADAANDRQDQAPGRARRRLQSLSC